MTQYQQPLKNLQQSQTKLPEFSEENLFLPDNRQSADNRTYPSLVAPGGFKIPSLGWLEVFKIEFPLQRNSTSGAWDNSTKFMSFACRALEIERKILNVILDSLDQMSPDLSETFQVALLQHPAIQNLIRRLDGLREENKQMIPGVYLGTPRSDPTLGVMLIQQLSTSWNHINRSMPDELNDLCAEWSNLQHLARSAIIFSSWNSLVSRLSWPVPTSFETNVGYFLEGQIPPNKDPYDGQRAPSYDEWRVFSFAKWQAHIEALSSSTESHSLGISLAARAWRVSGNHCLPAELVEELRNSNPPFPMWEAFLRDDRSVTPRLLTAELFPDETSRPLRVSFRHGVPEHIAILEQQALEYGSSLYLSNFDIRKVTIVYPQELNEGSWRKMQREPELEALANAPIAEFISEIEFDCSGLTEKDCVALFEQQLYFLTALEKNESWRNCDLEREVGVAFKYVSTRIGMLLRLKCAESIGIFEEWKMQPPTSEGNMGNSGLNTETLSIRWVLDAEAETEAD